MQRTDISADLNHLTGRLPKKWKNHAFEILEYRSVTWNDWKSWPIGVRDENKMWLVRYLEVMRPTHS
ncbi:Exocyst complex component 3 [Orchesella cincta]|uniref:Exocyst complex component 3 n=1 Tax=Orchesella cincta TaxID=48709 RepID=A0A1D2M399_ORCCI|nr:Exocyst complex component 3 [Orchesella cincta]